MLQYCIKQIQTNINKYMFHVLSIKLRYKLYFSFSILTPGFPHFYYMLGANLGLLLYGEASMMSAQSRQNLRCSLIQAVSQEKTFRQKANSLAPLNGWACAVKICHDGMLEDTNSLDGAHIYYQKLSSTHCCIV